MSDREKVYVEIVRIEGGEVVEKMGPMSRGDAEHTQRGVQINMAHERFYTRLTPVSAALKGGDS